MVATVPTDGLEPYAERELAAVFDETPADRRRRGRRWYPAMREWAEQLAAETGYTLEQVVAVLAITSPGAQLVTNQDWTEQVCRGEKQTAGRFPNVNRPKIAGVLASPEAAHEYVIGPKVGPFHHAILGDRDALVIDRWATAAANPFRDDALSDPGRRCIESAYRSLARKRRLKVRELQAIIWTQVRETTPDARGRVRKFQDVTL